MVELLFVDAGNTRIKWRDENDDFSMGSEDDLLDFISRNQVKEILLANVRAAELTNRLKSACSAHVHVVKVEKHFQGLTVAYDNPASMGVDRWLNMLAVHHRNTTHGNIVVSCGTAITIDVLLAGKHLGGYILPGLGLQAKALCNYTANLPEVSVREMAQSGLGSSTRTAIANGISDAVRSLIVNALERLPKHLGTQIIMTGGDAKTLSESFEYPFTHSDQLIFEGMDVYMHYIQTQNEI